MSRLEAFLRESLAIEGIHRAPDMAEIAASKHFLALPAVTLDDICAIQYVYAPGHPLRIKPTMNVRVGNHIAPRGGIAIKGALGNIVHRVSTGSDPWEMHVEFETLHPFMDGNGRTGRILWAWNMQHVGQDPFALPFLHRWYYQTLAASRMDERQQARREALEEAAAYVEHGAIIASAPALGSKQSQVEQRLGRSLMNAASGIRALIAKEATSGG